MSDKPEATAARMDIWKWGYFPMTLGEPVKRPIKTAVAPQDGPVDIGAGYSAYVISAPDGSEVVAEASTGALVGDDLDTVRADVAEGDPEMMREQIENSRKDAERAERVSAEDFFRTEPR